MDNVMNPFWLWIVEFMPMWLAPNMITLLGTMIMVMGCGSFLFYDLSMTQMPPQAMSYLAGLSVFIYQTLDAIDGKQARRTGQSSPLGQLFDHGCDAMSLFWV
jgi:phosphatidylglycerophosphate synthase